MTNQYTESRYALEKVLSDIFENILPGQPIPFVEGTIEGIAGMIVSVAEMYKADTLKEVEKMLDQKLAALAPASKATQKKDKNNGKN